MLINKVYESTNINRIYILFTLTLEDQRSTSSDTYQMVKIQKKNTSSKLNTSFWNRIEKMEKMDNLVYP